MYYIIVCLYTLEQRLASYSNISLQLVKASRPANQHTKEQYKQRVWSKRWVRLKAARSFTVKFPICEEHERRLLSSFIHTRRYWAYSVSYSVLTC